MTKKIKVSGIAVRSGTSKNMHKFLPEELVKASERARDFTFPLIKDHVATTENTIGRITFGRPKVGSDGETEVPFEGFAMDDGKGTLNKIQAGVITEVSIGAHAEKMVKESDDDDALIPIGIHLSELSTTPTPAVAGTNIANESETIETPIEEVSKMTDAEKKVLLKEEEAEVVEEPAEEAPEEEEATDAEESTKELAKIKAEIEKLKLEQAKAELAKLKESKKVEPKAIATADVKEENEMEGYIVAKDEEGTYISRIRE